MDTHDESREAFVRRAGEYYDSMMDRAGLESGDTFDDIETQAEERGRKITQELIASRLVVEEAAQPEETPCPRCGHPMRRPSQTAKRNLDTGSGCVRYHRRHAICDRCGESFSPSGPPTQDPASGRVEPPPAHGV